MENLFDRCKEINDLLIQNEEQQARDSLIILLQELKDKDIEYTPLVNHLIREVGLYPYIDEETADWQERFVCEAFKVDAGGDKTVTLHREQSAVLKALLNGEDLAISAPTSFGKSFTIDTFIALKKPRNVVIIVPTIALTDEIRRRINDKFSKEYKIITTTDVEFGQKNIFIFPQERAILYAELIEHIDLLVVDEFYKAGRIHSNGEDGKLDERAHLLIEAICRLSKKTTQRYFLAPNVSQLHKNPFTEGMRFLKLDFNTVYTEIYPLYHNQPKERKKQDSHKLNQLKNIISEKDGKSLIYVGSHAQLQMVCRALEDSCSVSDDIQLIQCADWIKQNYGEDYFLAEVIKKGVGVHNGRLHRSLSQIQVRLFEKNQSLKQIVSTSSIIEGVNTSAENVIIFSNKLGKPAYDYFTYKNIVGRSGRMFKHFVGKVYLLDSPPTETSEASLLLDFPAPLLERLDRKDYERELSKEQILKIKENEKEMDELLGDGGYRSILSISMSQGVDVHLLKQLIYSITSAPNEWKCLAALQSDNYKTWASALYKLWDFLPGKIRSNYKKSCLVNFIQVLSFAWRESIPKIREVLKSHNLTVEGYLELEKYISFEFTSLLISINALFSHFDIKIELSKFIARCSSAFLPRIVYELEEYGLPRMISRKIQDAKIIDLERGDVKINDVVDEFIQVGKTNIQDGISASLFESYIIDYFYEGITPAP